jgi:hypothetical protein
MTNWKLALVDPLTEFYARTGIGITPTEFIVGVLAAVVVALTLSD